LDHVDEVIHIFEFAINARESDTSNIVGLGQVPHDDFADLLRRNFEDVN
jgi:hypothetical protein